MKEKLTEEMKEALTAYRMERAGSTVQEAIDMLEKDHFNAAINRLYYACYYAVSALLIKNNLQAHTHSGLKQQFGMSFILSGKLPKTYNITYTELFDKRHSGDYDDFLLFDRETVERLLVETEAFINAVKKLLGAT
jgi:uncharacterized protein (UPF0332 family)